VLDAPLLESYVDTAARGEWGRYEKKGATSLTR
jgi:hypothetical protein